MDTNQTNKNPKASAKRIKEAWKTYLPKFGRSYATVKAFIEEMDIPQAEFYQHFSSILALEEAIWLEYFTETLETLQSDADYEVFPVGEKLLSFYYTFVTILKPDRSYITYTYFNSDNAGWVTPEYLCELYEAFKAYTQSLIKEGIQTGEIMDRYLLTDQYQGGVWLQFLFILDFWVKDGSENFNRTDAAIEKSVILGFDLMGRTFFDTLFDFAKFIFQSN